MGTTKSGTPARGPIRPSEKPIGGAVGALCTKSAKKTVQSGIFPHVPKINIAVLCLSRSIRIKINALGAGLFVSHAKSI